MKRRRIKITVWREGYKFQYRYWEAIDGYWYFLGMCEHFMLYKKWYPNDERPERPHRLLSA